MSIRHFSDRESTRFVENIVGTINLYNLRRFVPSLLRFG